MNAETPDNTSTSSVAMLASGFLLGAVVVGACWLTSIGIGQTDHRIVRDVTVDYMYETDPGSASGHNDLEVASLEFLPGYVAMTDANGRTQLLALERLRRFNYQPTDH